MSSMIALIQLDWAIAKKYRIKQFTLLLQLLMVAYLFYFISETLGVIPSLGSRYLPFVLSGLAFQYLVSGISAASANKLVEWRELGVLTSLLMTPTSRWKLYLQAGGFAYIKAVGKFALFLLLIGIFEKSRLQGFDLFYFLTTLVSMGALALSLSIIQSMSFLVFKRVSPGDIFATFISLFLSGVYFPITILPTPLKFLAICNPIFHGLAMLRLSLGLKSPDGDLANFATSLTVVLCWTVFFGLVAVTSYIYGESHLNKNGGHLHQ